MKAPAGTGNWQEEEQDASKNKIAPHLGSGSLVDLGGQVSPIFCYGLNVVWIN
jgi:hypothetical protein